MILLPSQAPSELQNAYKLLGDALKNISPGLVEIVKDTSLKNLPNDQALVI